MKMGLFIISLLIYMPSWADMRRSSCNLYLANPMPYQGTSKLPLLPKKEFKRQVIRAKLFRGLIYDDHDGELLNIPDLRQFVINRNFNMYISTDSTNIDHSILGAHRAVPFAGMLKVTNGKITNLIMLEKTAYRGSVNKMLELIQYLSEEGVDLSSTTISLFFNEDPVYEVSVNEFLNRFRH
ncbi:MAG: hypothetical protein H6625_07705 [Bdellovibrionaceae bacterium]|nr:hypothetical protein [Pseudobdellovibrionaceae bacterium]